MRDSQTSERRVWWGLHRQYLARSVLVREVTGSAAADQPRQQLLGQLRNLVSGILWGRSDNQFTALCSVVKGVRKTNSKGSGKHKAETSPRRRWQSHTAQRSVHRGANCNSGVDWSPASSLQSRFSTLRLPSLWRLAGCTPTAAFMDDDGIKQRAWRAPTLQQRVLRYRHTASNAKVKTESG